MSLPCLAFSREPLGIAAAAGWRPDRSGQSGRDATPPSGRLERHGRLSRVTHRVQCRGRVAHVQSDPCGKAWSGPMAGRILLLRCAQ